MTGGLLNRLTGAAARRGTRPRGRVDAGRRGVPGPRLGRGRIRGRARLGAITGSRGRTLRIGGRRSPSTRRIHRGGRRLLRGDVARRHSTDTHTRRPISSRRLLRGIVTRRHSTNTHTRRPISSRRLLRGIVTRRHSTDTHTRRPISSRRLLRGIVTRRHCTNTHTRRPISSRRRIGLAGVPRRDVLRRRLRGRRIGLLRLPRRDVLRRRLRGRRIGLVGLPRRDVLRRRLRGRRIGLPRLPRRHAVRPTFWRPAVLLGGSGVRRRPVRGACVAVGALDTVVVASGRVPVAGTRVLARAGRLARRVGRRGVAAGHSRRARPALPTTLAGRVVGALPGRCAARRSVALR